MTSPGSLRSPVGDTNWSLPLLYGLPPLVASSRVAAAYWSLGKQEACDIGGREGLKWGVCSVAVWQRLSDTRLFFSVETGNWDLEVRS